MRETISAREFLEGGTGEMAWKTNAIEWGWPQGGFLYNTGIKSCNLCRGARGGGSVNTKSYIAHSRIYGNYTTVYIQINNGIFFAQFN